MAFWCFMLATDLLVPLIMIGFGGAFARHAPREINGLFGYRTPAPCATRTPGPLLTTIRDG